MKPLALPWADERGSVLLISLVLIAVMTLLGLALFDLAAMEGRLALTSQADARAFEAAQAGIERALRELYLGYISDGTVPPNPSWADNTNAPVCVGGCVTTDFRAMTVSNTSMPGSQGSYAVDVKLLLGSEATDTYSQTCLTLDGTPATACKDLVFVRSTGVVLATDAGGVAGYTARRTIQALARATAGGLLAGVVAGSPSDQPMRGNVLIAGSIHILADPVTAAAMSFSGGAGQRNNWNGIDASCPGFDQFCVSKRLMPVPLICPPGSPGCAASAKVESLGGQLLIAGPPAPVGLITSSVVLASGGADLGENSATPDYGTPTRKGKITLDAVYVANGCQNADCSDSISRPTQVFVDDGNLSRPYPYNPPPTFPLLTRQVTIAGNTYDHFACPTPALGCAGTTYMNSRAADFSAQLNLSGRPGDPVDGLTDGAASPDFATTEVSFTNKSGATRYGRICWKNAARTLSFLVSVASGGTSCVTETPVATPADPLLVYLTTGFKIDRSGGPNTYIYNGSTIIVANGLVTIEESIATPDCTVGGTCQTAGFRFPEDHSLGLLTFGDMQVGITRSGVDRVMGLFYTQQSFVSQKQSKTVGSVTAYRFCFGDASPPCPASSGGGNVPRLFQVPSDPRAVPEEYLALGGRRWNVAYIPRFWLECRRGSANDTLPSTVSGICGY